jgi:hypothetical protein
VAFDAFLRKGMDFYIDLVEQVQARHKVKSLV